MVAAAELLAIEYITVVFQCAVKTNYSKSELQTHADFVVRKIPILIFDNQQRFCTAALVVTVTDVWVGGWAEK